MKIYRELIAAGVEVVFDVSEETGVDEFIAAAWRASRSTEEFSWSSVRAMIWIR